MSPRLRGAWLTVVLCLASAALTEAQSPPEAPQESPGDDDFRARALPTPQLRWGDRFTIELITKLQTDIIRVDPDLDGNADDFDWRRRRFGVRGQVLGWLSYEVEREFRDKADPWRDVYANAKVNDLLEVRAGLFKVPFSLDNLTGSTSHDFVYKSVAARTISPGRDPGLQVWGRSDGRRFTYFVGMFRGADEETTHDAVLDDDKAGESLGRTFSARVSVQPLDAVDRLPRALRNLEFGVNGGSSTVPEGLNGVRGRSVFGFEFFAPVYVKGHRVRAGADAALFAGPTSVKAEWIGAWDERRDQGLGDETLPDVRSRGWYTSGTWLLTGERKQDSDVRPRRPLFQGGFGAVEAAVRFERLSFGSSSTNGEPAFANPRAAHLLGNRDDILTMGVTWYLNRWFKLQTNAIHETLEDPERTPLTGVRSYWSYVSRLQFAF